MCTNRGHLRNMSSVRIHDRGGEYIPNNGNK
ncbi:unnamed protein product [Clostridium phage HM2]|nr:unnamed protein product [Clostridium phage HM2]